VRNAVDISGRQAINGQQVRFLEQNPVPPSLRGREATLERTTEREAIVWVSGSRRRVPIDWLAVSSRPVQGSTALTVTGPGPETQGSAARTSPSSSQPTSHPDLAQPAAADAEGDDDPTTEQAWCSLLEACLELGLSLEEGQQMIAEVAGVPPDKLDPSRLTWRQYLQVIERLEKLESAQGQLVLPSPPPPPPPTVNRETAKAIYPPPNRYLGVTAYNELVAIAANLELNEASMVARLGIPDDCPGYLLDRPWVFAIARGLAAIAVGQQPGQPDLSKAVLKFGYRSDDGPRLVVVGMDGTLLHGDPVMVVDMARQLRIPVSDANVDYSTTRGGIPQPVASGDPATPKMVEPEPSPTYLPTDDTPITKQEWEALLSACRRARLHPMQRKRLIADAAGIPICDVGVVPLTREQYRRAVARLEEYRSGKRNRLNPECVTTANTATSDPPAQIEGNNGQWEGNPEQSWEAFYKDCRELGLELWQAQQLIADTTGIPLTELDISRLTRQHLLQAYERLEELERNQIRVPLSSPPPAEPKQSTTPWDAAELPHRYRLKSSRIPWAEPFQGGIPPWRWEGYWCEEDREDK